MARSLHPAIAPGRPTTATVSQPPELRLLGEAVAAARRHRLRHRLGIVLGQLALVLAFLLLWDHASGRLIEASAISDPLSVLAALWQLGVSGRLWPHLWQTLAEVLAGFAIGSGIGLGLALVFALAPASHAVLRPYLIAFYSIPKIALAPLIIMWFGLGTLPKVVLAAAFVFFIVFMNAAAGIEAVNPQHVTIARVMGAGRLGVLRRILLPSTLPFLILGLRLAIPEAMIGAVIGEFIAANQGLGYLVSTASAQFNTAVSLASILVLLLVVTAADAALSLVERRFMRWRPPPGVGAARL